MTRRHFLDNAEKPSGGGLYRRKADGTLERVSKHQLIYSETVDVPAEKNEPVEETSGVETDG